MKIIEYFTSEHQSHWLEEMRRCDWEAGQYLARLLQRGQLKALVGRTALVPMLIEEETGTLVSFCTFAPLDDIQPTELSPWVGFVYTFPQYRGHRYAGQLLRYAEGLATVMGKEYLYISTGHTGLYETYGYAFYQIRKDIHGEDSRVYRKALQVDGPEKEQRMELGDRWKGEIVAAARKGVDMTAICGFSCNHCFLGQWCGGCRSVFCCCAYGTLYPDHQCPNVSCCGEKGLDGCYACDNLLACGIGFYAPDHDGAAASKAQALFIRKFGKPAFFQVHDRLHQQYTFEKTQEILGESTEDGLRSLEECWKSMQESYDKSSL